MRAPVEASGRRSCSPVGMRLTGDMRLRGVLMARPRRRDGAGSVWAFGSPGGRASDFTVGDGCRLMERRARWSRSRGSSSSLFTACQHNVTVGLQGVADIPRGWLAGCRDCTTSGRTLACCTCRRWSTRSWLAVSRCGSSRANGWGVPRVVFGTRSVALSGAAHVSLDPGDCS